VLRRRSQTDLHARAVARSRKNPSRYRPSGRLSRMPREGVNGGWSDSAVQASATSGRLVSTKTRPTATGTAISPRRATPHR
jgi:hypothetical protein